MLNTEPTVEMLSQLNPGQVPLEIFNEIARLSVVPVVEMMMTSPEGVLLLKRQTDDLFWPDQYCLPGKIISSNGYDSLEEYVIEICRQFNISNHKKIDFCGCKIYKTNRGTELTMVYKMEVDKDVELKHNAYIIKVSDMDKFDIIPEHKDIITTFL